MAILYAPVARGTAVLAEVSAVTGKHWTVPRRLPEKLPAEADSGLCFSRDRRVFHILRSDAITFLRMSNGTGSEKQVREITTAIVTFHYRVNSSTTKFNYSGDKCVSESFAASSEF